MLSHFREQGGTELKLGSNTIKLIIYTDHSDDRSHYQISTLALKFTAQELAKLYLSISNTVSVYFLFSTFDLRFNSCIVVSSAGNLGKQFDPDKLVSRQCRP